LSTTPNTNENGGIGNGIEKVLAHAQDETRRKLGDAIKKQEDTGTSLMDILRQDLDRTMFRKIWSFLNQPTSGKADQKVKDVLRDQGVMSSEDWEELQGDEQYDPRIGKLLVDSAQITEEQLMDAVAQHERGGQTVWRVLVNRGLVSPKQIADARTTAAHAEERGDESGLIQVLLRSGLLNADQMAAAIDAHKETGRTIPQVVIDREMAKADELGAALGKAWDTEYVELGDGNVPPELTKMLPEHLARQYKIIPVLGEEDYIVLAMADPTNMSARSFFGMMTTKNVKTVFAFEQEIIDAIDTSYAKPVAAAAPAAADKSLSPLERIKARLRGSAQVDEGIVSMAEDVGVISLVASIMEGAINSRATDIHLEPQTYGLRVRYRIDGMLYDIMNLPVNLMAEVISRVKVLAGMDITERRHPQDGHFTIDIQEKRYDLRVATLPTVTGEKLVLRLLNPEDVFMGLRELGLEGSQLAVLQDAIAKPHGMVLVTGPIGSGKTSTLYAALSEVDIFTRNVVTIEDPVEYQLPGINQVQVDMRVDRTFATMLRAVLRQDANVMMVGEIRDEDTAHVAVRAAMTGHWVISTLHTNDAVGAIDTLQHLKVPAYLIASSVVAVVAQRLIRKVCPACREAFEPDAAMLADLGLTATTAADMTFYKPVGCDECFQTGYKGRTGLFEVLQMDDKIKKMMLSNATRDRISKHARTHGMGSLMEYGVKKIAAGITTPEEVLRVTTL
jgi:type II secretory ATPase GspE/PulE/Tfp pilus assembly ATPase PilB-like protein